MGANAVTSQSMCIHCWHTRTFPHWFTFHLSGNSSYPPRIVMGMTGHPSCSCMCKAPWHNSNTNVNSEEKQRGGLTACVVSRGTSSTPLTA